MASVPYKIKGCIEVPSQASLGQALLYVLATIIRHPVLTIHKYNVNISYDGIDMSKYHDISEGINLNLFA